jgi:hydrogenase maturation protease
VSARILVAGIGNLFLGDDGFGVEVVRRLATRQLPDGVQIVDYGIRGMDLVYALLEERDAVIFVDTAAYGGPPGTLHLIEPSTEETGEVALDTHGMDPVKVLGLARALGAKPARTLVVGCQPGRLLDGEDDPDLLVELTPPVRAAVDEAVTMVESLVSELAGPTGELLGRQTECSSERR